VDHRKGLAAFLLITFTLTYLIEGALILSGFRVTEVPPVMLQFVVAGAMWIPALATFVTCRFITHEKLSTTGLRFGRSWKPYLATAVLIPLCFLVTYLITWALGLGQPDLRMESFYAMIAESGADMSSAPDPTLLLAGLLVMSLIAAPFMNSLFGFGEEWGWRGYLLPRLMQQMGGQPGGKWKVYLLVGAIWGLWHAPLVLIGFNYPGYPVLGVLFMMLLTTAIGFYINELALKYDSSILAGWVHGVFNSQAYGIWRLIFPSVNPLLGGMTGLVGILVFTAAGLLTMRRLKQKGAGQARTAALA